MWSGPKFNVTDGIICKEQVGVQGAAVSGPPAPELLPLGQENPRKTTHRLRFSLEIPQRHIASPLPIKVLFSCVENSVSAWKRYFPAGCCWWSRKALCDVPWWSSQGGEMWLIIQIWYRRWPRARFPGSTDWDRRGNDGPAAQLSASSSAQAAWGSSL